MKKIILFVLLLGVFILVFRVSDQKAWIKVGDTSLKVDLADTYKERNLGLSGRKDLKEGEGMLFTFEEEGVYGFWMKDMNFAIDIIWIDRDGRVFGIEKDVKPETFPTIFTPLGKIKYVLEVPSLFSDTAGIEVGEILSIGQ